MQAGGRIHSESCSARSTVFFIYPKRPCDHAHTDMTVVIMGSWAARREKQRKRWKCRLCVSVRICPTAKSFFHSVSLIRIGLLYNRSKNIPYLEQLSGTDVLCIPTLADRSAVVP